MLASANYVAPLPDEIDFAQAAPLMCAGLTVYNGLRLANFLPGQRVAVIGLGGLGHLAVQYARAMGARVAVVSSSADKESQARELGAEVFIGPGAGTSADRLPSGTAAPTSSSRRRRRSRRSTRRSTASPRTGRWSSSASGPARSRSRRSI